MTRTSDVLRLLAILALTGCVGDGEEASIEDTSVASKPIVDGTLASEYPEAAYLDIDPTELGMYVCSGTLIAPGVVLTAGHCVDGHRRWDVHVDGNSRLATRSALYDWNEKGSAGVNPEHHDIGLLFLDETVELPRYPTLARTVVAENTRVTCVGRVHDGEISSQLYQADTEVKLGDAVGYPLDYSSDVIIQSGDSGGPAFRHGTHEIVGVNSGVGGDVQVLARVDLIVGWIGLQAATENTRARLSSPMPTAIGGTGNSRQQGDQSAGSEVQKPYAGTWADGDRPPWQ